MRLPRIALVLLVLGGCASPGYAPINDKTQPSARTAAKAVSSAHQQGRHIVQKGDTLYSIAFQNGLDYRDLAFWNNLDSPDVIHVGQVLRLTPSEDPDARAKGVETLPMRENDLSAPKSLEEAPLLTEPKAQRLPYSEANWAAVSGAKPVAAVEASAVAVPSQAKVEPQQAKTENGDANAYNEKGWRWPAEGKLLGGFGQGGGKGIDIGGVMRAPILAAAPGKVVYSGSGLRGYGKMIIVKHSDEFLTAYAHNLILLAKEGDWVKGGQKIAEMGNTDSDRVKLHFEVRQYGKPLDPLKYLPERR